MTLTLLSTRTAIKLKGNRFPFALILIWIFVAPVLDSAYVNDDYINSSSAIVMVPILQIISSIGIVYTLDELGKLARRTNRQKKKRRTKDIEKREERLIAVRVERRVRVKKVVVIIVVVAYLLSFTYFSYGYFVVHPTNVEDNPPTWAYWGYLFGFPEVAQFINEYQLYDMPIYISPNGLFLNNSSWFNFFYNVLHVPEIYLDYYTDGRARDFGGVVDVSSFYSQKASLIITGFPGDISSLRSQGLVVSDIYNVKRPDGQVAMLLIYVSPQLSQHYMTELTNYALSESNIYGYSTINNSQVAEIGNNFSAIISFEIPYMKYKPNNFYNLMLADPLPYKAPRFGFRIGSLSMAQSGASNSTMTLNSFLYTNHGNYSTEPGTFAEIWADNIALSYNVTYYAALVYSNNHFYLYLNGSRILASGVLSYPLVGMSSSISFDLNLNATIQSFTLYNFSLSGAQVGYLYYNGMG